MIGKNSGLPTFYELLLSAFGKSCSRSNFSTRCRQFVHLIGDRSCPVARSPDFICILGNDVIGHLVPGLGHVDLVIVGNDVQVRRVDIATSWNIEQSSIAKLSRAFLRLRTEEITVSRENVEAGLRTEVLLGSFVKGNVFL